MTTTEISALLKSLLILTDWLGSDPERDHEIGAITFDASNPKPFGIELIASKREEVRGMTLPDTLAQAAQVVVMNPELE